MKRQPFENAEVRAVFDAYPVKLRAGLLELRQLIFDTARATAGVGPLVETLKWGQPAYMPARPRTGSPIRIDALKSVEPRYAVFFHCQTTLVASMRERYRDLFVFEGNRALVFSLGKALPRDALAHGIAMALTYHVKRRKP